MNEEVQDILDNHVNGNRKEAVDDYINLDNLDLETEVLEHLFNADITGDVTRWGDVASFIRLIVLRAEKRFLEKTMKHRLTKGMNKEGLTLDEWSGTANFGRHNLHSEDACFKGWKGGEDPTEYAASPDRYADDKGTVRLIALKYGLTEKEARNLLLLPTANEVMFRNDKFCSEGGYDRTSPLSRGNLSDLYKEFLKKDMEKK